MHVEKVIKIIAGKTCLYANKKVIKYLDGYTNKCRNGSQENIVVLQLQKQAEKYGFNPEANRALVHEGKGVFRIGVDLKRIIGFNATVEARFDFVAVECFTKADQKRSAEYTRRCNQVARIKKNKLWVEVRKESDL